MHTRCDVVAVTDIAATRRVAKCRRDGARATVFARMHVSIRFALMANAIYNNNARATVQYVQCSKFARVQRQFARSAIYSLAGSASLARVLTK